MGPLNGSRIDAGGKRAARQRGHFRALVRHCIDKPGSKKDDLMAAIDGKSDFKRGTISACEAAGFIENRSGKLTRHDWHATDSGRELLEGADA